MYRLSKKDVCTAKSLRERVDYTLLARKILDIKQDKDNFYISSYWISMFRIMWHVLPDEKSTWIALTNIYGIGRVRSQKILNKVWIDPMKKVKDLSEDDQKKISDELKNYVLESDLKRETAAAIKRLKEIKCYRGMRHNLGLPVRWQLTRKNARTAKKLLGRAKVRPVIKK